MSSSPVCIGYETAEEYIRTLYLSLLGREPDSSGIEYWSDFLVNAGTEGFKDILLAFVGSEEFKRKHLTSSSTNNLESFQEFSFDSIDPEDLDSLFTKTAAYWRNSASNPEEIYWSVLTHGKYRGKLDDHTISDFLKTGMNDVRRLKMICEKVGRTLEDCDQYLDYGCGVGRLVVNLPRSVKKINCVDFSASHLEEAGRNLSRLDSSRDYALYQVNCLDDLDKLPVNQDIIHSFMVLQHNTPPIIERTIHRLLELLADNGIAILHVPIAKLVYNFDATEYLHDRNAGQDMEMHILPKANLYKLAHENGCRIVYGLCAGGCGGDIYSEIVVFEKLP